eukprot:1462132-Karenia_brevis.AAC.1
MAASASCAYLCHYNIHMLCSPAPPSPYGCTEVDHSPLLFPSILAYLPVPETCKTDIRRCLSDTECPA